MIWVNQDGLERGTGGLGWVWRLTDWGLGREEREKRGGGLLGVGDSIKIFSCTRSSLSP